MTNCDDCASIIKLGFQVDSLELLLQKHKGYNMEKIAEQMILILRRLLLFVEKGAYYA